MREHRVVLIRHTRAPVIILRRDQLRITWDISFVTLHTEHCTVISGLVYKLEHWINLVLSREQMEPKLAKDTD